jgi:hypothetical protein
MNGPKLVTLFNEREKTAELLFLEQNQKNTFYFLITNLFCIIVNDDRVTTPKFRRSGDNFTNVV